MGHSESDAQDGTGETAPSAADEAADRVKAPRKRRKRLRAPRHVPDVVVRLGVVAAVLAVAAGGIWGLTTAVTPKESDIAMEIPALSVEPADVEPGSVTPVNATIKGAPQQLPHDVEQPAQPAAEQVADWAQRAGPVLGVPPRALVAYVRAAAITKETHPGCKLTWNTLAGIGRVESNHGRFGGAELQDNGWPTKPIAGPRLDGSGGFRAIKDTDGGRFDDDTEYDRAVGPMQFIPSTWARHAADGNGDGDADPQQVDDATLAAARYLCHGGRDMSSAQGWWEGLWSYNRSVTYGQQVFGLADEYGKVAQSLS